MTSAANKFVCASMDFRLFHEMAGRRPGSKVRERYQARNFHAVIEVHEYISHAMRYR